MKESSSVPKIPVIGSWRLLSFELRRDDGIITFPFGENPHGMIVYTESGRFSAQLMRGDRPRCVGEDQMRAAVEEAETNFKGCISYYGSYTFHPERGTIQHHVEGSLFPNWEGRTLKRFYRLSGNRLELSTPPTIWGGGGKITGVIEWEKIGDV